MKWSSSRAMLHAWVVFVAIVTFFLLCSGGLVTSHGAGMAVPDWPNTFGYNMFLFPFSQWIGGIFFEHSHRLIATFTGLFTAILALWLWVRETAGNNRSFGIIAIVGVVALLGVRQMPVYITLASLAPIAIGFSFWRFFKDTSAYRWLGIAALSAVVLQGVLGGLRVVLFADQIGIFHAMLAQSFFTGLILLSVLTSRAFFEKRWALYEPHPRLRWIALTATLLIFLQLAIAATMRHEHIGLSIPDFPLAYGQVLPDTGAAAMEQINAARVAKDQMPTTAVQIWIQMAHRFVAVLIACAVFTLAWQARHSYRAVRGWTFFWSFMIFIQICLGAWTIWSNKAADVATAHMALGALSLVVGAALTLRLFLGGKTQDFAWPDVPKQPLVNVA